MKLILTLILVTSICKMITCTDDKMGQFTVFGSTFFTRNGKYNVAITSKNFYATTPILEVAVNSKNETWMMARNITLSNNGESQSLEFDLKDDDEYILSVKCLRGPNFSNSIKLLPRNVSVIIQTDKAVYRAYDKVQFRVLILDESLKPLNESNVQIYVTDSAQYRVKQFDDIVCVKGVYQGELKLSDSPILGNWHIVVLRNKNETVKAFEVAEYTLPTFQILINVEPHVNFNESVIRAEIEAKYTFGEMAKGTATITAEVENNATNNPFTKEVKVNSNTDVSIHIENDLGISEKNEDRIVRLFVTFTEELTGRIQNATANVQLHVLPYKIIMKKKFEKFKPGLPLTIEMVVQYHAYNRPITDYNNPVTLIATFKELDIGLGNITLTDYPTNGISRIDINTTESTMELNVTAKYLQSEIDILPMTSLQNDTDMTIDFIKITLQTETLKINKSVRINLQSVQAITEFSFHVLTIVGQVIFSRTIKVDLPTKSHTFEFTPTHGIEADMKIIVFYTKLIGDVIWDSLILEFDELKNFVDISIPDVSVNPNDIMEITTNSNHDSIIGIVGVDKSVLIQKSGNDISDSVFDKKEATQKNLFFMTYPAFELFIPMSISDQNGRITELETVDVPYEEMRTNFLETWLFECVNLDINETNATIKRKVPDTISSFTIVAFSLNPVSGLALTKRPIVFSVLKRLFLSIDLPHSIKLREIVPIRISVFNYMNVDQYVSVTLYNEDLKFAFVDSNEQPLNRISMTKHVLVNKKSGASTSFNICATQIGSIKIKVIANSTLSAFDWVERDLLVEPVGSPQFMNEVVWIDLRNATQYTTDVYVTIPPEVVDNSIKIEASIVGDILGLPIGNVNKLINVPHAGGEQNMITFVRNIVELDYLTELNLTSKIKNVTEHLEIAYQKQLNYRHDNGSFSVWGKRDESGSTWFTAFVAKSFRQASKYIFVDADIIKDALHFLSQKQSEDGSFVEDQYEGRSKVLIQGGSSDKIALTAYTLITFLENADYKKEFNGMIDKALAWLSPNVNNKSDKYSLATYAFPLTTLDYESLKNDSLLRFYSPNTNIEVTVQHGDNASTMFNVNKSNALLHMKKDLPSSERLFKVTATGEGLIIFQLSYQYNIETADDDTHHFNISSVTVNSTVNESTFFLKVCVNNIENIKSDAVMNVTFPSGCTFRNELSTTKLKSMEQIKDVDARHKTSVALFISNLNVTSVCPQFFFSRDTIVNSLRPASIDVYDFPRKTRTLRTFYDLPPSSIQYD